jgi:hypothetical protein
MVTGHFGLAAGVKAYERFVPLWALMLATVWLDIVFIPLYATGVEEIDDVPGTDGGYGDVIIHADYTHSLIGAALIAALTGLAVTRWWGRLGGIVIGAVVFSHWILDLVVHRDDMPIIPGDPGAGTVGFGLWKVEWASITVEAALLALGALLYWRAARAVSVDAGRPTRRADPVASVLFLSGAIVLALDVTLG